MDKVFESLKSAKNIAIVGLSAKQYRTSYHIAEYLIGQGYNIIPVNPNEKEIMELRVFKSIAEIPHDVEIHIINVFRNNRYTADFMNEVKEWVSERAYKPLIWTQLDVSSNEAEEIAREESIPYVTNRCIIIEHQRLN